MEVGTGGRIKGTVRNENVGVAWSGEGKRDFVKWRQLWACPSSVGAASEAGRSQGVLHLLQKNYFLLLYF